MREAALAALVALALALGGPARGEEPAQGAEPAKRVVRYEADALTVRLEKARLSEVLDEIGRQAGAEIRGGVREDRDVSAEFDEVPMAEALHRLLGDQNFALVYGEGERLRAIKLLGGPQAAPKVASAPTTTIPLAPPPNAAMGLTTLLQRQPPIPIGGRLAQALGRDSASILDILNAGLRVEDPAARSEAVRVGVQALEGDGEIHRSVMAAMNGVDDANLATMLRGMAGDNGEEFLIHAASAARTGDLRLKASAVLEQFRLQARQLN
jgi:hypothetical protein